MELDAKVRSCEIQLGDRYLMLKLSTNGMIAMDAEYHLECLTNLYRRCKAKEKNEKPENPIYYPTYVTF